MHWDYLAVFGLMSVPALTIAVFWFFQKKLTALSWIVVGTSFVIALLASRPLIDLIGVKEFNQNTRNIAVLFQLTLVTAVMAFAARRHKKK
jgi:hypothetical protein